MNKSIIILNGPICAGKSTITTLLMQDDNVFRGSSDAVKWLISNYSAENEIHNTIKKEITLSAISIATQHGFSVVIDGAHADYRDVYKEIAKKFNLIYISVNIEAPLEVLEKRFLERVELAEQNNSKTISVKTLEGFHQRYRWYIDTKRDPEGTTLDTSKLSAEEVVAEIKKLILGKAAAGDVSK